jgi:hypothetical protein
MNKKDFLHKDAHITDQLIELLNEWDFLEVMNEYEKTYDEYYDLVDPILFELEKGINSKELEEYLTKFISEIYGTIPSKVSIFTDKVVNWWKYVVS